VSSIRYYADSTGQFAQMDCSLYTRGMQLLSKDNKFDLSLIPLPVFSHFQVSFCFSSYWFEFCQHLQDQKDPIGSCCEKLVFCLFCLPNLLISLVSYFVFMFVYVSCL